MQEPRYLSANQILATTLVVKIAVIAVLAIVLVRYHRFRKILLSERRAWPDRLIFAFSLGIPMTAAVVARLLLQYKAADVTLEGAFLAGLIAGPYAGAIVGLMAASPATIAGEFLALPFAVGVGFAAGGIREMCPKEDIWHFSPLVFTSLPRRTWHLVRTLKIDWQLLLLLAPVSLEMLRLTLGHRFPGRLFYLAADSPWLLALVVLATVLAVGTPIKIWNNARIEHRLAEQERRLMTARIEALASQINPHFLFNTLASISSLIRTQPETARMLIVKLSSLLRRLLKSQTHFTTLREELESIDEYLGIEAVRFGPQLRVLKDIAPDTYDALVPSMILQPIVENSIKHGLSPKVGGGSITIRSRRRGTNTVLEVIDDGLGMSQEALNNALYGGIGLSNVNERLKVIYGSGCQLTLHSAAGEGTCARIEIPEISVSGNVAV